MQTLTPFQTVPKELNEVLDPVIPQLEALDSALDAILDLKAQCVERGNADRFVQLLEQLGYSDEVIAQFNQVADSLSEAFPTA